MSTHNEERASSYEQEVIRRQTEFLDVQASFLTLYQYASLRDLIVIMLSAVCALIAGAIIPLPPIIFGRLSHIFVDIENHGSACPDSSHLISHYSLFFVYIAIGAFVVWFVSTAGFAYAGANIVLRIRVRYMETILRQNIAFFDGNSAGQFIDQLGTDLNIIQESLSQKLSITISAVGTLLATYIVSFALYWKLALILIWSFFASLALLFVGNRVAVRYSGRSMTVRSTSSAIVEEVLSSIKSTTALGLQKSILATYEQHLEVAEKAAFTLKLLMGVMVAVTVGTGYLNVGLALWQGSHFLVDHETSFMAVVAITLVTKSAAFCVLGVGSNAEIFTLAASAWQRVLRLLTRVSPIDPGSEDGIIPEHVDGRIELKDVKHVYPSRPTVVIADGLNMIFPSGRTTAVVGPSGSGKSSIAKLITRFYEPVRGQIVFDSHNLEQVNLKWLRRQIRVVNQDPFLFDTSIYENIEYGLIGSPFQDLPAESKQRKIEDAAKLAFAHDFISALPNGYQTNVGSRGSKLSGGQKQRIALARALISDPKVLVLDEATSALDVKTEAKIQAALELTGKKRTTIIIAHRLSTIKNADVIFVLQSGAVIEQGTHNELMAHQGSYFELVQAQGVIEEQKKSPHHVEHVQKLEQQVEKELATSHEKIVPVEGATTKSSRSLFSTAKFVLRLNAKEWSHISFGLLCSIIAGLEEPVSAILFGKALVAISRPLEASNQIRSEAGFWAWMFFLLAIVMMLVFSVQGGVFAYCSERLIYVAKRRAFSQMLRQEISFFEDVENSTGALVSFLSAETAELAGISGGTLGMILIAVSTLVSAFVVVVYCIYSITCSYRSCSVLFLSELTVTIASGHRKLLQSESPSRRNPALYYLTLLLQSTSPPIILHCQSSVLRYTLSMIAVTCLLLSIMSPSIVS